jgi:hypothetical protein
LASGLGSNPDFGFQVRAIGPGGPDSTPAKKNFEFAG